MTLAVISLFSGVGMFDLGLVRAGMRIVAQVENDPWCQRVLETHAELWPDAVRFGDVRAVGTHNLPRADVICGGFPCQPISNAGKRRGRDDERWLWPEFARVVRELRPRYVLVENVAALLGRGMGEVLGDLAALGYDSEWECIPASAVGAPHRRDRIWIVAYSNDSGDRTSERDNGRRSPIGGFRTDTFVQPRRQSEAQLADPDRLGRLHGEPWEHAAYGGVHTLGESAAGGGAIMADADGERERQLRRSLGDERRRSRDIGAERDGSLADTEGERGQVRSPSGGRLGRPASGGEAVAHADDGGRERSGGARGGRLGSENGGGDVPDPDSEPQERLAVTWRERGERSAQSILGGDLDGHAARMDQRWPARPGEAQFQWEAPRLAKGVPNRTRRLKAIGNALVPQIAEMIGRRIVECERLMKAEAE